MVKCDDEILKKIIADLQMKHDCHTLILYGSRARDEHNVSSDYDIIAIKDRGDFERDCRIFNGFYLDAFVYPEAMLENPEQNLIRAKDGIVILQKNHVGNDLLQKIQLIYESGPPKTPAWEKHEIPAWLNKMVQRGKEEDVEGNFRLHWLLHDSLECYFKMRDLWYLGPKESFKWLRENDEIAYQAFDAALESSAHINKIADLIKKITDV